MPHTIEGSGGVQGNYQGGTASIQSVMLRLGEKKEMRGGATSPEAKLSQGMQVVILEKIC